MFYMHTITWGRISYDILNVELHTTKKNAILILSRFMCVVNVCVRHTVTFFSMCIFKTIVESFICFSYYFNFVFCFVPLLLLRGINFKIVHSFIPLFEWENRVHKWSWHCLCLLAPMSKYVWECVMFIFYVSFVDAQ